MTKVGLVANPAANSGRGGGAGTRALRALQDQGVDVLDLSGPSWSRALSNALDARTQLDALVVVGGDGMVHLGVQVCASTDVPLGIVPAGSGNDFASVMRAPAADVSDTVDSILASLQEPTPVDVGQTRRDDGHTRWFAGVLSAGIDAAIAERGRRMRFPRGALKYKAAVVGELPVFRPYDIDIHASLAGQTVYEHSQSCTLVAISNSGLLGGGIPISPKSSVTDGALELVIADALTRREIVGIFPALLRGAHIDDPRVQVISADQVTIAPSQGGTLPPVASADGEPIGHLPVDVRVLPGGLRLLGLQRH